MFWPTDLTVAGERLVAGLVESGMEEEAEQVNQMIDLKRDEHQYLMEDILEHEQLLDAAVAEQQNMISKWVRDMMRAY